MIIKLTALVLGLALCFVGCITKEKRRTKYILALALTLTLCLAGCGAVKQDSRTVYAMDTVMNLTLYGRDTAAALDEAEQKLLSLDREALSRTAKTSALYALNESGALEENEAALALIDVALSVSEMTHGAFDPTLALVLDAWGFTKEEHSVPTDEALAELLGKTGTDKVALTRGADGAVESVALSGGAQLDLGGIAKGYAGDILYSIFREHDISSAVIDLGGDVALLGAKPDGTPWRIAVKDPAMPSRFMGILSLQDAFVVTSGIYERKFEENGVLYHHIIDPATGKPAETGLVSVTVVGENGTWADALSTACFVLGEEGALALRGELAQRGLTRFDLLFVTDDGRVRYTEGLKDRFDYANAEGNYVYELIS